MCYTISIVRFAIKNEAEDGTGSRRPLLGDVGMSPHLFIFESAQMGSLTVAHFFVTKN